MDESVKTRAVRKLCSECGQQYPADEKVCRRDGSTLLTLPAIQKLPEPGEELLPVGVVLGDRYEILAIIGSGGMGIVYKARHRLMDRLVAVKMLNQETISNEKLLKRFQQEARTASMLSHPNIVSVFDYGVYESKPYLIMDYVEGRSLEDLIAEGPIPLNRYFSIFSQAADALSHAHQKGVVHRDVKPSNIMIEQNDIDPNYVRVLDFGIAKLVRSRSKNDSGEQKISRTGEVFGSAQYMSPEQCMGQEIGIASDIYSLGCVMYEALVGQPPLLGKDVLDTIYKQINDEPVPPHTVRCDLDIPEAIEQVILKAMRKDVARRFANMHELNAALEAAFRPVAPVTVGISATEAPLDAKANRRLLRPLVALLIALPLFAGITYLATGDLSFKARQLQLSLAFHEALGGPDSPQLIPLLSELSAEYRQVEPGNISATRLQERLTRLLEKHKPNSPELWRAKLDLAELFQKRNNMVRAKALRSDALQAMQAYSSTLPDSSEKKETVLQEAYTLSSAVFGPTSLEYADALTAAAHFHTRVKEWQAAETEYNNALKVKGKVFGEASDKYADSLEEYAKFLASSQNFHKATSTLERVLEIREKLHGKESALSARSNRALAKVYQEMGRTAQAESCLLAAIASQGAVTGPESQEVAPILNELAQVYEAQHNSKQAGSMYKLAVTIQENLPDANKGELAESLEGFSRTLVDEQKLDEAEDALKRVCELRKASGSPRLAKTLKTLAKVLQKQNKSDQAREALERAAQLEAPKKQ